MKKIYKSHNTKEILAEVLPNRFKIVNEETSNGFKFFNSLYGIELDSLQDYMDQATHFSSFENFDYGLDGDYAMVEFPELINSDYIYGDGIQIKITDTSEFMDGAPTRFTLNEIFDMTGHVSGSGIYGLEYMRQDKTGSGVLMMNTNIGSEAAIISDTSQTYKVAISDLVVPNTTLISGFNFGVDYQNFDTQQRYELLAPMGNDVMRREYAVTKNYSLPLNGDSTNGNRKYTVDNYEPVDIYWDNQADTYKSAVPLRDTYKENGVDKYHKVSLNNPSGSGVYDTEYLELEHIPISGTLKLLDIDSLTDGEPTEILEAGTDSYIYSDPNSNYTYLGYSEDIPFYEGVADDAVAVYHKTTSWAHVYQDDGLQHFKWNTDSTKPITNKLKIVNSIGRYVVEYTYVTDKGQRAITTTTSNRYVKYNAGTHMFSSTDIDNNVLEITNTLSKEPKSYKQRTGVTFEGSYIRPGSYINQMTIRGIVSREAKIDKSFSLNTTDISIPGYKKDIIPNIIRNTDVTLDYNNDSLDFAAVVGDTKDIFIDGSIGTRIINSNDGIATNKFYELSSAELSNDRLVRFRFKLRTDSITNFNFISSTSTQVDQGSWRINYDSSNFIVIQDHISTVKTISPVIFGDSTIDMIVVSKDNRDYSVTDQRYVVYFSVDGSFFIKYDVVEASSNTYTDTTADQTVLFAGATVDLDYARIYTEEA
jgi:hypothetical protein